MSDDRLALPGEINGGPIDRFTLAHFSAGVAYGLLPLPMWGAPAVAVAWEVVENPLKDKCSDYFPYTSHDVLSNAVVDTIAFVGGAYLARYYKQKRL